MCMQLLLQYYAALLRLGHHTRRTHWNSSMSPSDCVRLKQILAGNCSTNTDIRSVFSYWHWSLSLSLRMTSTCLLARVCSAPGWLAGRDTQWTEGTSLSRVNKQIITNIPDCVMMIELLRETNVPWKDLVKRVEYGPDVIQGEDIRWPLVKWYVYNYIYHILIFRSLCIKDVWLLTQTNISAMITPPDLSSSSSLRLTWNTISPSTSRMQRDQAQDLSNRRPRLKKEQILDLMILKDSRRSKSIF